MNTCKLQVKFYRILASWNLLSQKHACDWIAGVFISVNLHILQFNIDVLKGFIMNIVTPRFNKHSYALLWLKINNGKINLVVGKKIKQCFAHSSLFML